MDVIKELIAKLEETTSECFIFNDWVDEAIDSVREKYPELTYDELRNNDEVEEYLAGE